MRLAIQSPLIASLPIYKSGKANVDLELEDLNKLIIATHYCWLAERFDFLASSVPKTSLYICASSFALLGGYKFPAFLPRKLNPSAYVTAAQ
ncbi:hypothetical protein ALON55S_08546 [Alishewanella longhuensis]